MTDESPLRSGRKSHARDGVGGGVGEPASLSGRAAFLENWHWQSVVRLNERLCGGGHAQHGQNSETHAGCEKEWSQGVKTQRTLLETIDWLRSFHRQAPFLFFNGNTFADIARTLTDAFFAEFPSGRRHQAASLAAHYVAGVLDRDAVVSGIIKLDEAADFKPGDRVQQPTARIHARGGCCSSEGRSDSMADRFGCRTAHLAGGLGSGSLRKKMRIIAPGILENRIQSYRCRSTS